MSDESHPVLSCAEAVVLEKERLQGNPDLEWRAMMRAGISLGQAVLNDYREIGEWPRRPRILILAGKGHNSGDAFIAVREILKARPLVSIDVLFLMGEEALAPLARRAWSDLLSAAGNAGVVHPFSLDRRREIRPQLETRCGGHYHLCLDGVFGMNFRPPFREPLGEVIRWINDSLNADLRAAVDLPSGLSDEPSDLAFRAVRS
jgi:ADP-dependent NAD(P)H-hydrate dehydratase / NAD(P)H-hydrate epimerase